MTCHTNTLLFTLVLGLLGFTLLGLGILVTPQTSTVNLPTLTATPTPVGFVGTFDVSGYVYDAQTNDPIPGAYIQHSHFGYISVPTPIGAIPEATTDSEGYYEIGPFAMRDTDTLSIMVTAEGYWPNSFRITGFDAYSCLYDSEDFRMAPTSQPQSIARAPCLPTPTPASQD
jgi:hypothetical protein